MIEFFSEGNDQMTKVFDFENMTEEAKAMHVSNQGLLLSKYNQQIMGKESLGGGVTVGSPYDAFLSTFTWLF